MGKYLLYSPAIAELRFDLPVPVAGQEGPGVITGGVPQELHLRVRVEAFPVGDPLRGRGRGRLLNCHCPQLRRSAEQRAGCCFLPVVRAGG